MALASPDDIGVVGEVRFQDAGLGISCQRVRDEEVGAGAHNKDGRVRAQQDGHIGAIGPQRGRGADDHGENNSRLEQGGSVC